MFCGIFLGQDRTSNCRIVSEMRCHLASNLDVMTIQEVQEELAEYWKPYLINTGIMLENVTGYETSMRYSSDVKLSWECTKRAHCQIKLICKCLKIRMPQNSGQNILIFF